MTLMPASRARWMIRMQSSRSGLPMLPNDMAPRHSAESRTPDRPSCRSSMPRTSADVERRTETPRRIKHPHLTGRLRSGQEQSSVRRTQFTDSLRWNRPARREARAVTATPITEDTPFVPEDDTYHRVSDDPYEFETNWWSLNIPE